MLARQTCITFARIGAIAAIAAVMTSCLFDPVVPPGRLTCDPNRGNDQCPRGFFCTELTQFQRAGLYVCCETAGCLQEMREKRFVPPTGPDQDATDGPGGAPGDARPQTDGAGGAVDGAKSDGRDAGPVGDTAPRRNGQPCAAAGECESGFCSDDVCCNESCAAPCKACNLVGSVGTCALVPSGEDPRGNCNDDGPASCKQDGSCDGTGGCRRHAAGAVCAPPSCSGSTRTLASRCDGAGACVPPAAPQSCAPYVCNPATGDCHTMCTTSMMCLAPNPCSGNSCGKKPVGQPCMAAADCNSGFCQQGVCCQTACAGLCRSCALSGSAGSCTNVPAGADPLVQCPDDGIASCDRDSSCDGAGMCRLYPAGTGCAAAVCMSGTATTARTCNGTGTCRLGTTMACTPFTCGGSTCRTMCTDNTHCVAGRVCTGGNCVVPGENCGDGIDNDGDGMADCADPDCTGAGWVCTGPAPGGWTGPVALYNGAPAGPACSGNYPTQRYEGNGGLGCAPVTCSACSCAAGGVTCGGVNISFGVTSACASNFYNSVPVGSCFNLPGTGYQYARHANLEGSTGSCASSGGTLTVRPAPTWSGLGRVCGRGPLVTGGCAPAETCAPRAPTGFGSKLCIFASGDLACPAGPYSVKTVLFADYADGRACSACACGTPVCTKNISLFSSFNCNVGAAPPPLSCQDIYGGGINVLSFRVNSNVASCPTTGGAATGACTEATPTTVCCRP